MKIIDWDPATGDLCQGDVEIFRVPHVVSIDTTEEITPRDGRLILAEGEVTGHHHAIWNPQPALFRDDAMARELEVDTAAIKAVTERLHDGEHKSLAEAEAKTGTARLYRAPEAVRQLVQLGELTHGRLAIGLLVVDGGPVVLRHDEHDAVRLPEGRYYVGGQSEWDAAEERRVAD
jgi:hypothetical protein